MLALAVVTLVAFSTAQDASQHEAIFGDFQIQASDAGGVDVGAFFSRFGLGSDISDDEKDPLASMLESNLKQSGAPNIARILSFARSADSEQIESIVNSFRRRAERDPDDRIAELVIKYGQPVVDNPETLKLMSEGLIEVEEEVVFDSDEVIVRFSENSGYRGMRKNTSEGVEYNAFMGVRYADPPNEGFRFQPPRLVKQPTGIEEAVKPGSVCPQYDVFNSSNIVGDEDCLFLNIYSPKLPDNSSSDGLPVMIYIHGGSFVTGDASIYRPDYLVQNNVVLVVIQYRLGSLGFISNEDQVLTGNYAMYDQIMAFDWVKRNIANFGGNPNDVTIFGQSAGAACVHMHLVSPLSKGLFHGAISQSGTALDQWAVQRDAKKFAARLAAEVGCEADISLNTYICLQKLPAKTLVAADKVLRGENESKGVFQFLGPVIQKPSNGFSSNSLLPVFLSEEPALSLRLGRTAKVPLIVGVTRDETVGYIGRYILARNNDNVTIGRPMVTELLKGQFPNLPDLLIDLLDHEYFDGQLAKGGIHLDVLLDASNDFTFRSSAVQTAAMYSKTAPVYFYSFEYPADVSLSKVMNTFGFSNSYLGGSPKVEHGDDLPMLFPLRGSGQEIRLASDKDLLMRDLVSKMWTNFARFKNPTPSALESTDSLSWLTFSEDMPRYMKFGKPTEMVKDYRTRQMRFLHDVMPKLVLAAQLCAIPLMSSSAAIAPIITVDSVIVESIARSSPLRADEKKIAPAPSTDSTPPLRVVDVVTEWPVDATTVDAESSSDEYAYDSAETDVAETSTQTLTTLSPKEEVESKSAAPESIFGSKSSQSQLETKPVIAAANLPNSLDHIHLAKQTGYSIPTNMYHLMKFRDQPQEAALQERTENPFQVTASRAPAVAAFDLSSLAAFLPQASAPEPEQVEASNDDVDSVLQQLPPHFQALARTFSADHLKSVYSGLKSNGQLSDLVAAFG